MSFVGNRLITRSQKWLKLSLQLFGVQKNKGCFSQLSSVAYIWGAGDGGQLGTGAREPSLLPVKFPVPGEVSHVGCGHGFTVAADANSSMVWTTGLNTFSQLGRRQLPCNKKLNGPSTSSEIELLPTSVVLPTTASTGRVQQISCGRSHSAILMDDGQAFTCGGHYQGQCGVGNLDARSISHFTKISSISSPIKQIACGLDHTILLTNDGKVLSCGWGADGQTGLGHFRDETTLKLVEGELKDVRIKQIATSADCCLALSDEGEVFSWGNNEYNQLATASDEEQLALPTRASLLKNLPEIKQVAAGGSCCVALTVSGELYSWGYGVLGHGREVSFTKTPRKIQEFVNTDEVVTQVTCGPDFMAVITDSGALYTWGRGSFGKLGLGSNEDQWVPKKVALPGKVMEVNCGLDHMAVIVRLT